MKNKETKSKIALVAIHCWQVILTALESFVRMVPQIIIIINPYITALLVLALYEERGEFCIGGEWLLPLFFTVMACFFKYVTDVYDYINDANGCPVARKRFTKRGKDGRVIFNSNDLYEMIEYLAAVEEYHEERGGYIDK